MSLSILIAVALDGIWGEPRHYHPLVGFGRLARWVECRCYGGDGLAPNDRRSRGLMAVTLLILPFALLGLFIEGLPYLGVFASLGGLYLALGGKSLQQHAEDVKKALAEADLQAARSAVGRIVSRDTGAMGEKEIAAATVESVLENGCDALFGALFWFVIAGLPAVIVYRLANTLDAMWGYRSERYRDFGWAAARFDDVLNFLPARLTALSYGLCGSFFPALRAWRTQAPRWKSPNAGPVMAAGAGALQISLGGPAIYHGELSHRPGLGYGRPAEVGDIARAVRLVQWALLLWLGVIVSGDWILA